MSNLKMLGLINLIAECHEVELSEARAAMYASDLVKFTPEEINEAWRKYRINPVNKKMPTAAELIQLVPDGHLSANESWAMIPRNEDDSVIWSEEMSAAYAAAAPLIREGNFTSAFFAYKETYERLVQESKIQKRKPKWTPSFGFNKSGREAAIIQAIEKKRIPFEIGVKYIPELEYNPAYEQILIAHGKEKIKLDSQGISRINKLITSTEK